MNVNTLFPSKYLKADDLGDREVIVTIRAVTLEDVGHGAERERKLALAFEKATKLMLVNRTNAMIIASLHTPETDNWVGKQIILYAARVKAFGSWHQAVRVKEQVPPRNVGAARIPEAMQDAPLDDEDDVLDIDEGEPPTARQVDTDTGEIMADDSNGDVLFAPEPHEAPATAPRPKQALLSVAQLTRVAALGTACYGEERWQAVEEARWADNVSTGNVKAAAHLLPDEATALIAKLEKRLKTRQAARVQATAEPVSNGAHA